MMKTSMINIKLCCDIPKFHFFVFFGRKKNIMENRIEISSDDEFDLDKDYDIPLGQRLAIKRTAETSVDREPPLKKTLSCAFTDDDEEEVSTPAPKIRKSAVEVTPPPPATPFTALARSSSRLSDLPDTQEMLEPRRSESVRSAASLVSGSSSVSSRVIKTKKTSREDKENDRQRKQLEKQQKKQQKETEKKSSKAVKEAEKLVAKQTDKTEVNKYLSVIVDPALVSAPPGSEILNLLQNPVSGKPEHVFQFRHG